MRSTAAIMEELRVALRAGNREESIGLCRLGISQVPSPLAPEWYFFQLNFANSLLGIGQDKYSLTFDDVDVAILAYQDILVLPPHDEAVFAANMGLGWAYYLRHRGVRRRNLELAVYYYKEALEHSAAPTGQRQYHIGSLRAAIGLCYADLVDEGVGEALSQAVQYYEDALDIFTREQYPDDWQEVTEKLAAVRLRGEITRHREAEDEGDSPKDN